VLATDGESFSGLLRPTREKFAGGRGDRTGLKGVSAHKKAGITHSGKARRLRDYLPDAHQTRGRSNAERARPGL